MVYESFPTEVEANFRIAEIEMRKAKGDLIPPLPKRLKDQFSESKKPEFTTVSELMDSYVELYGRAHWSPMYLSLNLQRIEDYINPFIGDMLLCHLTPQGIEKYYCALEKAPAVVRLGHKEGKTISPSVIEKIHILLRAALDKAVLWGYIDRNPALSVTAPKAHSKPREVWTPELAQQALAKCENHVLRLCMLLALGCSMRIGEILGLTWDCVTVTEETIQRETSMLAVTKQLERCDKSSLKALKGHGSESIQFIFPELKKNSDTCLVLKDPKTMNSNRNIFIPKSVAIALLQMKDEQAADKALLGDAYTDYNLVIAQQNGRPWERKLIDKAFKALIKEQGLPPVVFHSLRHSSASIKLRISGGDIKAVQGDTGHAQASTLTDIYAHIFEEDRRRLATSMEEQFFQSVPPSASEQSADSSAAKPTPSNPDQGAESSEALLAPSIPSSTDPAVRDAITALTEHPELAQLISSMKNLYQGGQQP